MISLQWFVRTRSGVGHNTHIEIRYWRRKESLNKRVRPYCRSWEAQTCWPPKIDKIIAHDFPHGSGVFVIDVPDPSEKEREIWGDHVGFKLGTWELGQVGDGGSEFILYEFSSLDFQVVSFPVSILDRRVYKRGFSVDLPVIFIEGTQESH
jgi:hypothetical protein